MAVTLKMRVHRKETETLPVDADAPPDKMEYVEQRTVDLRAEGDDPPYRGQFRLKNLDEGDFAEFVEGKDVTVKIG